MAIKLIISKLNRDGSSILLAVCSLFGNASRLPHTCRSERVRESRAGNDGV